MAKKRPAELLAEQEVAAELVRQAKEKGLSLTGPDGLLKQLTKSVIEAAVSEELTDHLGYAKNDPAAAGLGNIRNGTRSKTVLTENTGNVEIDLPRDRAGTFEPQIVKKRQRRLNEVYGVKTVRTPEFSGASQVASTCASGTARAFTVMVPESISSTSDGNSAR